MTNTNTTTKTNIITTDNQALALHKILVVKDALDLVGVETTLQITDGIISLYADLWNCVDGSTVEIGIGFLDCEDNFNEPIVYAQPENDMRRFNERLEKLKEN